MVINLTLNESPTAPHLYSLRESLPQLKMSIRRACVIVHVLSGGLYIGTEWVSFDCHVVSVAYGAISFLSNLIPVWLCTLSISYCYQL